jgi:hypothetical protein
MSQSSNDFKGAISDTDKPTVEHVDTIASLEKNPSTIQWDAEFEKKTMCVFLLLMFSCTITDGAAKAPSRQTNLPGSWPLLCDLFD